MIMGKREITRSYREAKHKSKQISVLAELNGCTRQKIVDILVDMGEIQPKNIKINSEEDEVAIVNGKSVKIDDKVVNEVTDKLKDGYSWTSIAKMYGNANGTQFKRKIERFVGKNWEDYIANRNLTLESERKQARKEMGLVKDSYEQQIEKRKSLGIKAVKKKEVQERLENEKHSNVEKTIDEQECVGHMREEREGAEQSSEEKLSADMVEKINNIKDAEEEVERSVNQDREINSTLVSVLEHKNKELENKLESAKDLMKKIEDSLEANNIYLAMYQVGLLSEILRGKVK